MERYATHLDGWVKECAVYRLSDAPQFFAVATITGINDNFVDRKVEEGTSSNLSLLCAFDLWRHEWHCWNAA